MGNLFFELTVILAVAAFLSILLRLFKQPPILAYILSGFLLGTFAVLGPENKEALDSLAEIGVTLLLFSLGLELKFSELKSVGKTSLIAGFLQISLTGLLSYGLAIFLGFKQVESLFIAAALTFSSTIIVVKLLSDKKDLRSLYGKISIGILLFQDFVAIFALIFLAGFAGNSIPSFYEIGILIVKAIALFSVTYLLGRYIIPKVIEKVAKSSELLFLFTLAWAFGMSAMVASPIIGFSIEIGGFLAGLALANTSESFQIVSRIRPLRDFFITIFFVTLGIQTIFVGGASLIIPIIVFLIFVILVKPLIILSLIGILGHRKRTSFLSALTLGQISEFSLILLFTGSRYNLVSAEVLSVITAVGAISFIVSTYSIIFSNHIYKFFSPFLGLFETKNAHENRVGEKKLENHIILVGFRKMGQEILHALEKDENNEVIVIDFDPDIVEKLRQDGFQSLFGDIADPEIQDMAGLDKAKFIISTVSDIEDNSILLRRVSKLDKKPIVVVLALEKDEAEELYREGADYVVLPHIVGGHHLAKMLIDKDQMELMERYKEKDLKEIRS